MLAMLAIFLPSPIRKIYFLFRDIFTASGFSYDEGCAALLFFMLGCQSLCDFVRRCPWSPSVSSLSRAARKFEPNRFMRRNQSRILKRIASCGHRDFCFAVDDTANPKYGNNAFASAPFHSSGGPYFGQKILVLVIVNLKTGQALPISYAFLTGKKDPDHVPGHFRAIDLIQGAIHNGFPPLPVISDSWFDSKEFIRSVKDLGCEFAGELKATRLARTNSNSGSPRQKLKLWFVKLKKIRLTRSRFQKRHEKRGKAFSQATLFIKDLHIPLTVIAVYNRINGSTPFAFYATTDLSMTGARLWKYSRARWAIEVMFRDLKQSLSFGGLTAGGEGGAHMAVCIPLILLTSIRLDGKETWGSKSKETLGTTVQRQREIALAKAIDAIVASPHGSRAERLRARRKNPNEKPTNLCGEKISA
jgi:hypothetical protein